jgi:calcium-dependent protein kinase
VVQKYPIAGTLTYLAPEAMKGVLTNKSDMWSTGVLMHLLLTGVSPFKGKNEAETKQFVLNKELNYNAYPLSHLSECAKDLLRKLLDRSIYKRISANQALAHPWLSQRQLSH